MFKTLDTDKTGTFKDFMQQAMGLLPVYAPGWTNHNLSDPGITFLELFAWFSEMQVYSLSVLSPQVIRKFLNLVGIRQKGPVPARITITLKSKVDVLVITKGTMIGDSDGHICFSLCENVDITKSEEFTTQAVQAVRKTVQSVSTGLPGFQVTLERFVLDDPFSEFCIIVKSGNDTIEWEQVDDLDSSMPWDRHFMLDQESSCLRFGDGINGRVPPPENINITYYQCAGKSGNVKENIIMKFIEEEINRKVSVISSQSASGGMDPETLEQAVMRAAAGLKNPVCAVTSADYEKLVRNFLFKEYTMEDVWIMVFPGRRPPLGDSEPENFMPGEVTIVIIPFELYEIAYSGKGSDASEVNKYMNELRKKLEAVREYLDKFRLLTTNLFVMAPGLVPVSIYPLNFCINCKNSAQSCEIMRNVIIEKVKDYFLYGPDNTGWPPGRSVYLNEVKIYLNGINGIEYITECKSVTGTTGNDEIRVPENCVPYLDISPEPGNTRWIHVKFYNPQKGDTSGE